MSRAELHATKCRACMFPLNAASNCVPIFKEYKSNTMLSLMIAETTNITPDPYDNLGINVCKLCAEKIFAFYEFRQSYMESDKKLREMLHNFDQRLNSDSVYSNHKSVPFEFAATVGAAINMTSTTMAADRFECHECGKSFDRDLALRIHSHTHRTIDTPSQQNDSQNGFDENFLLANIKTEPVEYDLDPMEWAEVSQSDVDNLLMGSGDGSAIDNGDDGNGELRWKCTICQDRFLRRAHLRAHRRQHAIDGQNRPTKSQNRAPKPTNEKKPKDQIQIKSIPQINHDSSKISINVLKKKKQQQQQQQQLQPQQVLPPPPPSPPAPLPTPSIELPTLSSVLPSILNLTADAQYERWLCKKCGLSFRTRRLLRTHNIVHRNTSVTSLDFDASHLGNLAAAAAAAAAATAINETSSPYQLDVSSFASVTMDEPPMPNVSPATAAAELAKKITVQHSPKSHSTPLKSSDARWKCPKCRKVFETPKALRKHKLSHHTFEIKLNLKSKNFVSEKKNVSFDLAMNSKKRSTIMTGTPRGHIQRDWPCSSCHQVFNRRSLLREHRRTAHMLKPTALPISIMKQEVEEFTAEEYTVTG